MAKTILGKVSITPAGMWNAMTAYKKLDLVESPEGSFLAKMDNANTPVTNNSVWQKIADRGPAGEGNVTVSATGLKIGKKYLFSPSQNDSALGTFEEYVPEEYDQKQADWNQEAISEADYIKNKPTIPNKTSDLQNDSNYITNTQLSEGLNGKVDKSEGKALSSNDFTTEDKEQITLNTQQIEALQEAVSTATNESLGVVKGSTDIRKVSINSDGSMSVNLGIKHKTNTILTTSWVASETHEGLYETTIEDAEVIDGSLVTVTPDIPSNDAYNSAGIYLSGSGSEGNFTIYAKSISENDITINYTIQL